MKYVDRILIAALLVSLCSCNLPTANDTSQHAESISRSQTVSQACIHVFDFRSKQFDGGVVISGAELVKMEEYLRWTRQAGQSKDVELGSGETVAGGWLPGYEIELRSESGTLGKYQISTSRKIASGPQGEFILPDDFQSYFDELITRTYIGKWTN